MNILFYIIGMILGYFMILIHTKMRQNNSSNYLLLEDLILNYQQEKEQVLIYFKIPNYGYLRKVDTKKALDYAKSLKNKSEK